jgi:hypothetical protein
MYLTNLKIDQQPRKATIWDEILNNKAGISGTEPDHPPKPQQRVEKIWIIIIKKR